jgi:hypothetical protein
MVRDRSLYSESQDKMHDWNMWGGGMWFGPLWMIVWLGVPVAIIVVPAGSAARTGQRDVQATFSMIVTLVER